MPLDYRLLSFAFSAGLVSFLNPCGIAMLPAYVGYYFGKDEKEKGQSQAKRSLAKNLLRGLAIGLLISAGFFTIFSIAGLIITVLGSRVAAAFPILAVFVGIALIFVGLLMLFGKSFSLAHRLLTHNKFLAVAKRKSLSQNYFYGIGYGLASLGCTLPIFLLVVAGAVTTEGFISGMLNFLFYAAGMSAFAIAVVVALSVSKGVLMEKINTVLPFVRKISAVLIIAAGAYIVYKDLTLL